MVLKRFLSLEENLTHKLPMGLWEKGYNLLYMYSDWNVNLGDVVLKDKVGNEVFIWHYFPSLGELFDKGKELV